MNTDALFQKVTEAVSSPVIAEAANLWFQDLAAQGRSPRTVSTYAAAIRNLDRFLIRRSRQGLNAIRPCDLDAWQRELVRAGCRPASINLFVRVVRRLFRWLAETGVIFTDPARGLIAPKIPTTLGRCPTEDGMRQLLDGRWGSGALVKRDRAILELAYATGARLEELVRLDLSAIDFKALTARLRGKGSRERVVPVTARSVEALAQYLNEGRIEARGSNPPTNALFLSSRGGCRLGSAGLADAIKRRAKRCRLDITPHAIRRAFATHLLRGGAHVTHLKDLIGHQTYRHLRHYLRLQPSQVVEEIRNQRLGRR